MRFSARLLSCGYSVSCEHLIAFSKAEMKMALQYRIIVTMCLHGFLVLGSIFESSLGISCIASLEPLGRTWWAQPPLAAQGYQCSRLPWADLQLLLGDQLLSSLPAAPGTLSLGVQIDWASSVGLKWLSSLCRSWSKAYSSMLKLCGLQFLLLIHSVSYRFSFVYLWAKGKGCLLWALIHGCASPQVRQPWCQHSGWNSGCVPSTGVWTPTAS